MLYLVCVMDVLCVIFSTGDMFVKWECQNVCKTRTM